MTRGTVAPVEIYTDGACLGNPGPGGWAALLRYKDTEKALSGGECRLPTSYRPSSCCRAASWSTSRPSGARSEAS